MEVLFMVIFKAKDVFSLFEFSFFRFPPNQLSSSLIKLRNSTVHYWVGLFLGGGCLPPGTFAVSPGNCKASPLRLTLIQIAEAQC